MEDWIFPPPESADADGIVCVGGPLAPERLLAAYRCGIFPWPIVSDGYAIPWCSPDPRAILELDRLHVSRRLARTIRGGKFELSCDRDFASVIAGCAAPRRDSGDTWVTDEMKLAYFRMHQLGHAHSVEAWCGGELAGGVYGLAIGGLFAGESMFYRVHDASKVALVALVKHLARRGYTLFDIQQLTSHMQRMGAVEIPRAEYLRRLKEAVDQPVTFGDRLEM
jgi:leucyl/phenylalanyl-tRNA--protein transferase